MVALHHESDPQRTSRLVGVHHVDALLQQDTFGLGVVSYKVGEHDVCSYHWKCKVVHTHPAHLLHPYMAGVAMCYDDHPLHPSEQKPAQLLDLHLHSSQTGIEKVAHQRHRHGTPRPLARHVIYKNEVITEPNATNA